MIKAALGKLQGNKHRSPMRFSCYNLYQVVKTFPTHT